MTSRPTSRRPVVWAKRLLPAAALGLLGLMVVWPEWRRDARIEQGAARRLSAAVGGAQMVGPRYRGVDVHGRPYTVTAESGVQTDAERVRLLRPVGDVTLGGAAWLLGRGRTGAFRQRDGLMDLSGDAEIYRSDGTRMIADAATLDTKQGAATSDDRTHAEGPFGTLDAQGFAMLDRGGVVQFVGPARAVMRGSGSAARAAPQPAPDAAVPAGPPRSPRL